MGPRAPKVRCSFRASARRARSMATTSSTLLRPSHGATPTEPPSCSHARGTTWLSASLTTAPAGSIAVDVESHGCSARLAASGYIVIDKEWIPLRLARRRRRRMPRASTTPMPTVTALPTAAGVRRPPRPQRRRPGHRRPALPRLPGLLLHRPVLPRQRHRGGGARDRHGRLRHRRRASACRSSRASTRRANTEAAATPGGSVRHRAPMPVEWGRSGGGLCRAPLVSPRQPSCPNSAANRPSSATSPPSSRSSGRGTSSSWWTMRTARTRGTSAWRPSTPPRRPSPS